MVQQNDVAILRVPFNGDWFNTASRIKVFFEEQIEELNLTNKLGHICFVDIPVGTNENASGCMAFLRFENTSVHHWFASKFNGVHINQSVKLTVSISSNRPMTFSKYYLEQKIAWVNPQFLTSQLEKANAERSVGGVVTTIETSSSDENQSPAQTTTSPVKPKVSERIELNDLHNKLKAAEVVNVQLKQTII